MVSTLIIVIGAVLSLFLVWEILRSGTPEIRSLDDWERKKHEIDLVALRISRALRLRVNLLLVQAYLWLKWFFPGWMLSVPALEMPYEELLGYLGQIQQQRHWDVQRKPVPT
jgi:hypothetical protein